MNLDQSRKKVTNVSPYERKTNKKRIERNEKKTTVFFFLFTFDKERIMMKPKVELPAQMVSQIQKFLQPQQFLSPSQPSQKFGHLWSELLSRQRQDWRIKEKVFEQKYPQHTHSYQHLSEFSYYLLLDDRKAIIDGHAHYIKFFKSILRELETMPSSHGFFKKEIIPPSFTFYAYTYHQYLHILFLSHGKLLRLDKFRLSSLPSLSPFSVSKSVKGVGSPLFQQQAQSLFGLTTDSQNKKNKKKVKSKKELLKRL